MLIFSGRILSVPFLALLLRLRIGFKNSDLISWDEIGENVFIGFGSWATVFSFSNPSLPNNNLCQQNACALDKKCSLYVCLNVSKDTFTHSPEGSKNWHTNDTSLLQILCGTQQSHTFIDNVLKNYVRIVESWSWG